MKAALLGVLFLSSLLVSTSVAASDAASLLSFADALFDQGDHYRAVTEYKRYLHSAPDGSQAPRAALRIGESYLAGERWQQADRALLRVEELYAGSAEAGRARMLWGESPYRRQAWAEARRRLGSLLLDGGEPRWQTRARYLLAWSFLEQWRLDAAGKELERLSGKASESLLAELPAFAEIPSKSPGLAGGLSAVLPGTGQLYAGRYRDAALSLLLNAAFIVGAIESFDDGNEVVGSILVFFEAGWYTGNIFNAVNSAHKFNRDEREKRLRPLRERFAVGLDLDADALRLQLQLRY